MDTRVTCVMPTMPGREAFWWPAIKCFLGQTYEDAQLLILDESEGPVPGPWDDDERIIYRNTMMRGLNVGQKRNLINSMVETDVICHWDDDDWYHPEYLARQLVFLDLSERPIVGYSGIMYLKLPERTLWKYRFPGKGPYATGASLCYLRSWWEEHPFLEDRKIGEDSAFYHDALRHDALRSRGDEGMIVARAHAGNTFKPSFGIAPFLPADRSEFPEEFLREAQL